MGGKELEKLNLNMQRANSFSLAFLRGILSGLGFAVGSIVLFAIVIYAFARAPIVGKYIADVLKEVQKYR